MSMGSYTIPKVSFGGANQAAPITAVNVNKSLLMPLNIDIDPDVHAVRNHEKEQIKSLNNQFASFIDKVRLNPPHSLYVLDLNNFDHPFVYKDVSFGRYFALLPQVRYLEQQNKMLETKWKLLQEQTASPSNVEPMLKSYIANLQRQLELLNNDKTRLDMENEVMHKNVNDYKTK